MRRWTKITLLSATLLLSPFVILELALFALPFDTALLDGFPESRRFLDADGRLLREVVGAGGTRARWTPLAEISPLLVEAVLAVEDTRFWDHSGVDLVSVARAALNNMRHRRIVSGASTLSMQLSRLTRDHPRSYGGKLAQTFGALALERAVDKRVILEHYLNRAPFGTGSIGAEAASQRYLGKPTAHLSLSEAALLAGLLQSPASLNPLRHEERARRRQHHVLDRMLAVGMISPEEHERARRQPWTFQPRPPQPAAMHFTEYLLTRDPPTGDVATTVDGVLQAEIEQMVAEHVRVLAPGGLTQAAVVVLDNRRCEILALVGSTDYWSAEGAVNGATARRQPGSALKPFTYALGFERLYTPATVVADVETRYHGRQGELYSPRNYSETYSGPLLMGEALGRSLNVPAIRVANGVGTSVLLERLRAAGFASLDQPAPHYGLGLTLGNGEVTLLELAQGFALFARRGQSCTAHGLCAAGLCAHGLSDTALEPPRQVFSPEVSYLITDILSDEDLRIRAFGASNPLLLGFPMAVKTGTSSNWRDNWAVGYTERYTVAVWTGDFQGRSMNQLSGAVGAGPLFHNVARRVVERGGIQALPRLPEAPEGVEEILVCPLSGMAAGEHCPHRRSVAVLETAPQDKVLEDETPEAELRATCSWHRRLRVDRRNGLLASERCPDRFVAWQVFEILPPRYAEWQASQGAGRPPTRYSPLCPDTGLIADALVITHPRDGEVYLLEPGYDPETQSLRLAAEVDPPLPEVTWLVDGQVVASASWPYEASWRLARGRHRLEVLSGGRRSDPVELEVR